MSSDLIQIKEIKENYQIIVNVQFIHKLLIGFYRIINKMYFLYNFFLNLVLTRERQQLIQLI